MSGDPRFLSVAQLERDLGLTRPQVLTLITTGELPAFMICGEWRVERRMLDGLIDRLYERSRAALLVTPEPSHTASDVDDGIRRTPERPEPSGTARLTPQQRRVGELLIDGLSNAEIAERLDVEVSTVKTHVSRMLQRLDLRDRHQLIAHLWRSRFEGDAPPGEVPRAPVDRGRAP